MKLHTLHTYFCRGYPRPCRAVVITGRMAVVMPGRIVVDEPDMLAVLYAAGHLFMFLYARKTNDSCHSSSSSSLPRPRDLCRQPSYIHHKSQIIYLHPSIVSRRSSIIVIACHCHLSSSSSVLHIQQQSSIVNHQALTINNQS